MKRNVLSRLMAVLLSLGAALAFCSAGAQNTDLLDRMCAGLAKSCAEMECSWSARLSGVATAGTGELKMQGDMWTLVGNGVEMWCDGEYKGDIRGCMNPKRTPDGDDFQGDIYIRLHRDWSLLKVKR